MITLKDFQVEDLGIIIRFLVTRFELEPFDLESKFASKDQFLSKSKQYKIFLTSILVFIFVFLDKSNINIFFLECGRFFFIGVLTYFIFEIIKKNFWLVTLSLFLIILGVVGNLKLDLFFSGIILLAAFCDTVIKIKNKKIYSLLGNLTYSSYLLHIPVQLVLMILILKFNFDFEIFNKNYFFILYLISIYSLSYFSFKYFENPVSKYIRNKYSA